MSGSITGLGTIIFKALEKGHPMNLSGKVLLPPFFNSKSATLLQSLPDHLLSQDVVKSLEGLQGKPLDEAIGILNKTEASNPNAFVNSLKKLLNPTKNDSLEVAKNELISIYEKQASEALNKGNSKRFSIRYDFAQKIKNGKMSKKEIYENLFDENYQNLRMADYPITSKFNKNIEELTAKETSQMMVTNQGGWHYRVPKNRHNFGWSREDKVLGRVSINAQTDSTLIAKLDDLLGSGKIKGYYKTPSESVKWLDRHDPITVYLHEQPTQNILDEIAAASKNSIRSTDDVLVGNKFAPGLALEKSPSTQDIQNLLDRAVKIDSELADVIRAKMTKNNQVIASAGQITSAEKIIKLFNQ